MVKFSKRGFRNIKRLNKNPKKGYNRRGLKSRIRNTFGNFSEQYLNKSFALNDVNCCEHNTSCPDGYRCGRGCKCV